MSINQIIPKGMLIPVPHIGASLKCEFHLTLNKIIINR